MRDRPSLSRYRGMVSRAGIIHTNVSVYYPWSRASLPQKRTSGSDGLDGERKYKFNFEIKLRSVEEKEAFKRRLSKVRGLLTPPGSSKPIDNLGLMYEFFDGVESTAGKRTSEDTVLDRSTMSFVRDSGK